MDWLVDLFAKDSIAHTILLFALVIAVGLGIGKYKFRGITLGVTWILFAGLAFSWWGLTVNEHHLHFLKEFGLVLFVYAIGLQVGVGFFESLKKNALNTNLLAGAIVLAGVGITIVLYKYAGENIAVMTGVMSGAVTNTPGLGAAQTALQDIGTATNSTSAIGVAYALSYPFGVGGILLSILLLKWILRIDTEKEKERHRKLHVLRSARPVSQHLLVENKQLEGKPLRNIFKFLDGPIVISRMRHKGEIITPTPEQTLAEGDILLVVAPKELMSQATMLIGPEVHENLKLEERSNLISRHVVVTRSEVTHKRLGDVTGLAQHHFTMTRLQRAGTEMVPNGNIFLQLGDIVKVVGTQDGVDYAAGVLGNEIKRLEVPYLATIFLGIALGVIVGSIPFTLPNIPAPVKIGLAGGPLIVALLLTKFGGRLYMNNYTTTSANMMMRELGIALFLASVGLSSGEAVESALSNSATYIWIVFALAITIIPLVGIGLLAYFFARKTYFEICGILAGASTDPPALAFATQMADSDVPALSYATVYPLTMILRIVAAQVLIFLFS